MDQIQEDLGRLNLSTQTKCELAHLSDTIIVQILNYIGEPMYLLAFASTCGRFKRLVRTSAFNIIIPWDHLIAEISCIFAKECKIIVDSEKKTSLLTTFKKRKVFADVASRRIKPKLSQLGTFVVASADAISYATPLERYIKRVEEDPFCPYDLNNVIDYKFLAAPNIFHIVRGFDGYARTMLSYWCIERQYKKYIDARYFSPDVIKYTSLEKTTPVLLFEYDSTSMSRQPLTVIGPISKMQASIIIDMHQCTYGRKPGNLPNLPLNEFVKKNSYFAISEILGAPRRASVGTPKID